VDTESGYYLQMKDDFGHTYTSPIFNLTREQTSGLIAMGIVDLICRGSDSPKEG
jgi:hypothetical protein